MTSAATTSAQEDAVDLPRRAAQSEFGNETWLTLVDLLPGTAASGR